jgi:WD40 repeat protein
MKPLVLQGHSRPIKDIKFSVKGDIVFTASNDRNVIMWKTDTGEKVNTYTHSAAVNKITLSCDMKYMITGDNTGSLYIWETHTSTLLIKLEQDPTYCIRSIDLTLNDYLIMILYASRMKNSKSFICVYKFQDIINLLITANEQEQKATEEIKLNNTDSTDASGNDDFFDSFKANSKKQNLNIKSFSSSGPNVINSAQAQASKKEAKNSINNIIMNTTTNNQNANPNYKMINLNLNNSINLSNTNINNSNVSYSSFKPIHLDKTPGLGKTGNSKVSAININPITLDLSTKEAAQKLDLFKYIECKTKETKYIQAKFSSLNKCLLVSREDGFLELINFNNGKLITDFKFHTDVIMDFDIDTKNGIILTSSIDGYACLINFDTFQVVNKFHPLNPTRNLNTCKIMNIKNPFYDPESDKKNSEMFSEKNINNFVFNLFNPNTDKKQEEIINLDIDSLFISSAMSNDTTSCKSKGGISAQDKELCFSIMSGGQDSKLVTTTNQKEGGFDTLIYNSITGDLIANFQDHFGPINTLAVNENAKLLASGAEDATIRIYKLENYLLNFYSNSN